MLDGSLLPEHKLGPAVVKKLWPMGFFVGPVRNAEERSIHKETEWGQLNVLSMDKNKKQIAILNWI